MTRTLKAPALVLKIRPVGENHRGLSMLVSGEGLITPLAYGAQGKRSALRGTAVPYNSGIAELHFDGVRNRWRLEAFDPLDTHDGLRENLDRFYTASTWAEILLGTHGSGGDSAEIFSHASAAFTLLSSADSGGIKKLHIAFLWGFLGIEGVQPDLDRCGRCGRPLPAGGGSAPARYLPDGLLAGPECADSGRPELPEGARKWIKAVSAGGLGSALKIGLPPAAVQSAEAWLLTVIRALLERPLRSTDL